MNEISVVKRPSRPKNKGLTFSSSVPKRKNSTSPTPHPTKRIRNTRTKVKTRILVIADTHGISTLPVPISPDQKIDILLHCGDLPECGTLSEYENKISLLKSIPAALKLVIPGNHDLTLGKTFRAQNCTDQGKNLHAEARELWGSPEMEEAGIQLLTEGTHSFNLTNGARFKVYASPYTITSQKVREWASGYESIEDRFNSSGQGISYAKSSGTKQSILRIEEEKVDVIMTHGPAKYRRDVSSEDESLGCAHLFRAMRRTRPKLHVSGHVHNAYGAEVVKWKEGGGDMSEDDDFNDGIEGRREEVEGNLEDGVRSIEVREGNENGKEETVFVNTALMGRDGMLENAPWLVELELERDSL